MTIASIDVSLSAILHNIEHLQSVAPQSQLVAVIKANAYGHGMVDIANYLQGKVPYFGVARLSEAITLREAGVVTPIVLLEGFFPHDNLQDLVDYDLQTVVHCSEQIDRLAQLSFQQSLTVWFKIDSGMHRLGFRPEDVIDNFRRLVECQSVAKPINLMTHFCCADEINSDLTLKQIGVMDQCIQAIGRPDLIGCQSFAASGGIFAWTSSHRDVVRPGIVLYGVSPFDFCCSGKSTGHQLGLIPAMTLKSELIAVRSHKQGESVGYGQTWQSPVDTKLGVVAMGYGDGYPRSIPANTPVLVNGRRVPIVGRVAMDMIVVDLGAQSDDIVGDEVIFWGKTLPVEEIAHHTGISAYELLTHLTSRAKINYVT